MTKPHEYLNSQTKCKCHDKSNKTIKRQTVLETQDWAKQTYLITDTPEGLTNSAQYDFFILLTSF